MSPNFLRNNQCAILVNSKNFPLQLRLRGYHSLWHFFPEDFFSLLRKYLAQHHIPLTLLQVIRFALCRVRSPLITASQLLSFPAPTRMFWFSACALADASIAGFPATGCPIRQFQDQSVYATPLNISQLTRTFIATWAKPSTKQRGS